MADTEHDGAQCVSSLSCCATGNRRVYVLSHAWTLENACGEWSVKKSYAVGNPPLYRVCERATRARLASLGPMLGFLNI